MVNHDILMSYLDWIKHKVCNRRQLKNFNRLFEYLYSVEFFWSIDRDADRAFDGVQLRGDYAYENGLDEDYICNSALNGDCSVLEMLVALAIRCESSIMHDEEYGDRCGQWFWLMISNLGLDGMTDRNYDEDYVRFRVSCFLNREYESNGDGGLFVIEGRGDLRDVDIWYQMCWYLDSTSTYDDI